MKYCCKDMESNVIIDCSDHTNKYNCPDCLVDYNAVFDEYGFIIHDGGTSSISIYYCPWCGSKLPESKRDLWFDTLEELGFDEPYEQNIPEIYKTSKWYEK